MRRFLLAAALLLAAPPGAGAADPPVRRPFEAEPGSVAETPLDRLVAAAQRRKGISPAYPCSDEVFLRRVHIDLLGALPEPETARAFLADRRPGRRAALVESLLQRDEFADYASLKWCDALRVKSEFPVNLWPNAVQAYHKWIRDALRDGMPYDRFVRALLTSSGSNFRDPPVNFWRAVQGREPASLAQAVALTFLGSRIEKWPEDRRAGLAALCSRVAYKKTGEWKEEIVLCDPAPAGPLDAVLPDGTPVRVPAGEDPRRVLADWLVDRRNPWFARAVVNRTWSWLFGRGVVHEPDDLRPDNPESVPGLLALLEKTLADAKWDLREVYRVILASRTYQQSPIPRGDPAAAEALFACYPVRRMDAEVLADALAWIGRPGEGLQSAIPEPFTFLPDDQRTVELADGSITSPFLDLFGRPPRDTGLESERANQVTEGQVLHFLNSSAVRAALEGSPRLRAAWESARGNAVEGIRQVYLLVLSRYPTEAELMALALYLRTPGRNPREAAQDLAWALVNSREFWFRH